MSNSISLRRDLIKSVFSLGSIIIALLFVVSCGSSMIDGPERDTEITLYITDADALYNSPNYNKGLIKQSCYIKDNRTNSTPQDPYNVVSIVNELKNVTWRIEVLNDPDDEYGEAIEFIIKKDRTSKQRNQLPFFNAKILKGDNEGKVRRPTNNNAKAFKKYTYSIMFSLEKNGNTQYFEIDPKLKGDI